MLKNVDSPEERRLLILRGIRKDLTNLEIASKMGVRINIVKRDLKAMKYHKDPELIQAYAEKKSRELKKQRKRREKRDERFQNMAGMTLKEKNFKNMVNYYRPELIRVLKSRDESAAITGLPRSIQRTLARNEIIVGLRNKRGLSPKARSYIPLAPGLKMTE